MNAHSLEQIATALERIESQLAALVMLLAAQQGVATTVLSDGVIIGPYDPASDTQVVSR